MSTDATEHMTTTPPLSIGTQRNILVVGPHPDDQELGMGGTIAMLAAEGHRVVILDMTSGEPTPSGDPATRAKEAAAAAGSSRFDPLAALFGGGSGGCPGGAF